MTPQQKKQSFIRTLLTRRHNLERAIAAEERRAHPDDLRLTRMKKLRLAIKDQLARLRETAGLRQYPA